MNIRSSADQAAPTLPAEKKVEIMRMLVTGGTGVLGRAFRPLAEADGRQVRVPGRD